MTTAEMYRIPVSGASTAALRPGVRVLYWSLADLLISSAGTNDNLSPMIGRHPEDRAAALRDLAQWSIEEADLDWDHLDRIDEVGWGTAP